MCQSNLICVTHTWFKHPLVMNVALHERFLYIDFFFHVYL